ncbi:hypothetical protein HS088_TW03G00297 [Tripterygium wilfordii]|uniref:Serine/arginine repetitive matrix protein 2-like n=1 Tax=Tripterygium wilfordii TaxID=458696 RepID=A0A7J7DUK1_TRIWF|nr:uncharacterized protein At1g65710-like [Tripterygium wilfordii]KAF5749969.1 hypothetical protein HS088_TW03G00297 [Tripterygium wilfordii]
MGCCVSKKEVGSSTVSAIPTSHSSSSMETHKLETQIQIQKKKAQQQEVEEIKQVQEVKKTEAGGGGEDAIVKKEVLVIKHSKSHDKERPKEIEDEVCNVGKVRTSSCSKEEVDAILIQCGRLSRSNSSGKANSSGGKKYSGSKRSYDFDVEEVKGSDEGDGEEKRQHRQRERRHNRPSSSSPSGRRRTPSRERDLNQQQQQRSGSRERSGGAGGSSSRRVSRSPGRRSDTNNANSNANGAVGTANRPGKMVSVPPTVSSSSLERSNNGGESAAIKRTLVKRNVGGEAATRGVASPRSQSPARANAKENQQQQPSLSRSSSRKAEQSPYRRNPLSEIDPNSLAYPQSSIDKAPGSNNHKCKEIEAEVVLNQKQNLEMNNDRVVGQGKSHKKGNKGTQNMKDVSADCLVKEQKQIVEEAKRQTTTTTVIPAGAESLKPQTVTRSRSSRRSRDLDINPEALLNAEPSYTRLLLEDIQNFHQKNTNTNTNTPSFSLPACVSKACSILEAVADLNSTTSSNLSCALSDDRRVLPTDQSNSNKAGYTFVGKKTASEAKDPFVESEVVVNDDLMEPSFHKYVTVRRGGTSGEEDDMDEQESSGSNSFSGTGAQQNWGMSSSSWEPSSVDSAGCWTSRFNGREEDHSNAPAFQRQGLSESGRAMDEARRGVSGKRNRGIGRNMVVSGDGFLATPVVAATASM